MKWLDRLMGRDVRYDQYGPFILHESEDGVYLVIKSNDRIFRVKVEEVKDGSTDSTQEA